MLSHALEGRQVRWRAGETVFDNNRFVSLAFVGVYAAVIGGLWLGRWVAEAGRLAARWLRQRPL